MCQAQVDQEQNTGPEPGHVKKTRDGPVPREPSKQPSLVPSGEGVTVSGMCVPTVGEMSNVDGELRNVCVAQLRVRSMQYV